MSNGAGQRDAQEAGNRREDPRFAGPFDGWRVGMIDTPLRILDLSCGGCFVDSMHDQARGTLITMKIALPEVGTVTLKGETLYERSGFGFAMRFVDVDAETAGSLARAFEVLQRRASSSWKPLARVSAPAVLPLPDALADASANRYVRDTERPRRVPAARQQIERTRSERLGMLGSGYRVLIDGQHVGLINLSLTGVQVRGPLRMVLGHPAIVKVGWPQDKLPFTAIARVRWVHGEPDPAETESIYRVGLAFETWDVRRLREIIKSRSWSPSPAAEEAGTW